MANFTVDPPPHVPKGFTLVERSLHPLLRQEVYLTSCYTHDNEEFGDHQVGASNQQRTTSVPSPPSYTASSWSYIEPMLLKSSHARLEMGSSGLAARERFLGPVFTFGSYAITVLKHDEAKNARYVTL
jgi:hypothetical protein